MNDTTSTQIECHQHTHDGAEFTDGFQFVLCANCQDRVTVETQTGPGADEKRYFYTEGTVIIGIVGWTLRAVCDWKCAQKVASNRAKNGAASTRRVMPRS